MVMFRLQLLAASKDDDKRIKAWMEKKTDRYTALTCRMKSWKRWLWRTFDRWLLQSDQHSKEQVVIFFWWVDSELEAHEEFASTHAKCCTLWYMMSCFEWVFPSKLRGQCYDGAASMSGARNGVAKLIIDEEPRALYTHCYGHALNLACSDAVKGCKVMRDVLDTSYKIVKLIKNSPRRDAMLHKLRQQLPDSTPGIRVLCPTRWTIRAEALHGIVDNFQVLQDVWDESLESRRQKCELGS